MMVASHDGMLHGAMFTLANDGGTGHDDSQHVTQLMIPITLVNQDVLAFGLKATRVTRLIGGGPNKGLR
jgi:hypothetical protein